MKLSKEEVEKIASLARLELSEAEKDKYASDLSAILEFVEQLNKINTNKVEPIAQITGLSNVMTDDEIRHDKDKNHKLLKNAPDIKDGFIKVKSILE
jgi:aspartyl-tRNA(Asn)/glutamyl-tRNA(Gln) amidotransferase subunit C